MIKINWTKFIEDHIITQTVYQIVRDRMWHGWWWASFCSAHMKYDKQCRLCRSGGWARGKTRRWGSLYDVKVKLGLEGK